MTAETTATKTLQATLAPPTAHKEHRLQRTVATYRRALEDSFESGADTQTAVNDVVTPYTLTSYAKDALKNYVPKLRDTYNAKKLEDDHPVRFTNRGWRLDHSEEREHEFCWRVPPMPSGFRSASTPPNASCGATCSTMTWQSASSDCKNTERTGFFTSLLSTKSRNQMFQTTQHRSVLTSVNPNSWRAVPVRTILQLNR